MNAEIEGIYQAYPRHVGKRDALRAIEKAIGRLRKGEFGRKLNDAQIYAGLKERTLYFASTPAGQKGVFTPHPATWFNRSSYLDDPEEWEKEQHAGGSSELSKHDQRNFKNALGISLAIAANVSRAVGANGEQCEGGTGRSLSGRVLEGILALPSGGDSGSVPRVAPPEPVPPGDLEFAQFVDAVETEKG
jgi:hypothetical protein